MKLTILSENTSFDPALEAEFGLSIYVEKGGVRLLFDTGSHGACLDNARRLRIDLSAVNVIAFSHNHWDHCGGFLRLADELHPLCPVYAHRGFFRQKWWDHRHDAPQEATRADTLEPVGPPMGADFFFQKGISGFRELPGAVCSRGEDIYLLGNFPVPAVRKPSGPPRPWSLRTGALSPMNSWMSRFV
jgi:glyoxylase-like metal-dependent hydrolase (beta-lactamase superfamily II)